MTSGNRDGGSRDEIERRGPWRVVGRRVVYENQWLRVREDRVIHPDGSDGMFGVVEGRPSAAIVAVDRDERICLVGQHRFAINTYSWDIPGGALSAREEPLTGAQRELWEETGLRAATWSSLGVYHPHRDLLEVTVHLFLARNLASGVASPDGSEQLALRWVSLDEALRLVQRGEVAAGTSVTGLVRAWAALHPGSQIYAGR